MHHKWTFGGATENTNRGGGGLIRTGRILTTFYVKVMVVIIVCLSHLTPPQNFLKVESESKQFHPSTDNEHPTPVTSSAPLLSHASSLNSAYGFVYIIIDFL